MTWFHVMTAMREPRLWVWRETGRTRGAQPAYHPADAGLDAQGLRRFDVRVDHQHPWSVRAQLHDGDRWERAEHVKTLPRARGDRFPRHVWCSEGASRVLTGDPFATSCARLRVHLVAPPPTADHRLYVWTPGDTGRMLAPSGRDDDGAIFDVTLEGRERNLFLLKLGAPAWEAEDANRLWSSSDGPEIWITPGRSAIFTTRAARRPLTVRLLDPGPGAVPARMHVWQENATFSADVDGLPEAGGWLRFTTAVDADRPHRVLFSAPEREHEEACRTLVVRGDETLCIDADGALRPLGRSGVWTLLGDRQLFAAAPRRDRRLTVAVSAVAPGAGLDGPLLLDAWVNRAPRPFAAGLAPDPDGRWRLVTFPEVVTSFRLRGAQAAEPVSRHALRATDEHTDAFVVVGRAGPLTRPPPEPLFQDPPFAIERPGPWVADGRVRFAVHCPTAASVEIIGEWTGWRASPLPMRSTRDGAYWWAEVDVTTVRGARPSIHGVLYKLLLDGVREVQDPAADWVESSNPEAASRLVDHTLHRWTSDGWRRPGWDWLTVYQLHPARFAQRGGKSGLDGVTREIVDPAGYLRRLSATALLLMPTCEFTGENAWGYSPCFYYSVESAYGGPDALKRLVDAAHAGGRAVLLDVVFNHASTTENPLWAVARDSFFDGDTEWGAMINFDHPQVIHFLERNLVHFMRHYRVDGFRFDFTRVIRHGHTAHAHVRRPGSGGGWELLRKLRAAVDAEDPRCLLMAEHLPNEWDLTHGAGPMHTQWCDDFHDRLVDAASGAAVMPRLADALAITHTACEAWHEATNYPESHDEVGNQPNRIARLGGPGRGQRLSKVAAAATLLARGIPMWFMGAESAEWRQFAQLGGPLDLDAYERDVDAGRVRRFWNHLAELRRGDPRVRGPSPLAVRHAEEQRLAFTRGEGHELFVLLCFGDAASRLPLWRLGLPAGRYREVLNSTWPDYQVEWEDEHANGGGDARLAPEDTLNVPDLGVVVLERVAT